MEREYSVTTLEGYTPKDLGELQPLPTSNDQPGTYLLKVNGRDTLLLNTPHFSARIPEGVTEDYFFYKPLMKALRDFQSGPNPEPRFFLTNNGFLSTLDSTCSF